MKNYCTIRHSIPGRLRLSIRQAKNSQEWFDALATMLNKNEHILLTRSNAKCNNLIIQYSKSKLHATEIIEKINNFIAQKESTPLQKKKAKICSIQTPECNCQEKTSSASVIRPALFRFMALSSIMGSVFIRKSFFGAVITQTAFSPLGLIAIASTYPLFKESIIQLKQKKFTLESFLGGACIAAVCAGEALTAFEILWINSGAELLKAWVTERSRKSISNILKVTEHHTFKLVDGVEIESSVSDLKAGDIVVLHTGEKVCVDGEIIDGHGLIDEAPITGRADLVPRSVGDTVLAGTLVRQGLIYVCANKVGDQTYLARILCLVEDSLANKAPIENLADKLAKNMIRLGFVATGLTFLITQSAWRAFTVMLVMACPCATVLAASTAVSAAMSAAAKRNILIKGGRYLETVGKADCVCFDKTGTLTTTEPELVNITLLKEDSYYRLEGLSIEEKSIQHESPENALLQLILSTEMHNHHPIAQAIKIEAEKRGITAITHTFCEYFLGMGVTATLHGSEIAVGNVKLLKHHGISADFDTPEVIATVKKLRAEGKTILFVAKDRTLIAILGFDNIVRPEAHAVIETLHQNGIQKSYLITGDEKSSARSLCQTLSINSFFASVMPEEKNNIVKRLQDENYTVLMVGDGINDAMALTQADVGIAMGAGGSEVAIEAADITLVNSDLQGLVYVHALGQQTVKVVHQNFWIAAGSNLVGLGLGAFGILSPVAAGMLHIVHTLGVLANSSRLLRFEPKPIKMKDINTSCQKGVCTQNCSCKDFPIIDIEAQDSETEESKEAQTLFELMDSPESAIDIHVKNVQSSGV